jgi:hypothetical protein
MVFRCDAANLDDDDNYNYDFLNDTAVS